MSKLLLFQSRMRRSSGFGSAFRWVAPDLWVAFFFGLTWFGPSLVQPQFISPRSVRSCGRVSFILTWLSYSTACTCEVLRWISLRNWCRKRPDETGRRPRPHAVWPIRAFLVGGDCTDRHQMQRARLVLRKGIVVPRICSLRMLSLGIAKREVECIEESLAQVSGVPSVPSCSGPWRS